MSLQIRRATLEDLPAISELAGRIWRAHYPGILTGAQIEYMLHRMYDVDQLRRDLAAGVVYELVGEGERALGFCGYEQLSSGELKLHKLYVEVSEHGRGIGSMVLRHVEEEARRRRLSRALLGVSRLDVRSSRAYAR